MIKHTEELVTRISRKQQRILVLSILYYEYSYSWVSDFSYDELVKELVSLQKGSELEICQATKYWYVFYDFEGSAGYYLKNRLRKYHHEVLVGVAKDILYDAGIYDY